MTLTIANSKTGRSKQLNVKTITVDKGTIVVTLGDGSKMEINPNTDTANGAITYTFN